MASAGGAEAAVAGKYRAGAARHDSRTPLPARRSRDKLNHAIGPRVVLSEDQPAEQFFQFGPDAATTEGRDRYSWRCRSACSDRYLPGENHWRRSGVEAPYPGSSRPVANVNIRRLRSQVTPIELSSVAPFRLALTKAHSAPLADTLDLLIDLRIFCSDLSVTLHGGAGRSRSINASSAGTSCSVAGSSSGDRTPGAGAG